MNNDNCLCHRLSLPAEIEGIKAKSITAYDICSTVNEVYDFRFNIVQERMELKEVKSDEWKFIQDRDLNTFNVGIKAIKK